jgi:hypothetical protein
MVCFVIFPEKDPVMEGMSAPLLSFGRLFIGWLSLNLGQYHIRRPLSTKELNDGIAEATRYWV